MKNKPHFLNEQDRINFEIWLVKKRINIRIAAERMNISPSYLSAILNGNRNVTPKLKDKFKSIGYELEDFNNVQE